MAGSRNRRQPKTGAKWYHVISHYIPALRLGTIVSPINNWRKMAIWFFGFQHHKSQHIHGQTTFAAQNKMTKQRFSWCWFLLSPTFKDANRSRGRKNAKAPHSLGDSILEWFVKDAGERRKGKHEFFCSLCFVRSFEWWWD